MEFELILMRGQFPWWQTLSGVTAREEFIWGGNHPEGIYQGSNYPGAIFLWGNCPRTVFLTSTIMNV